MPRKLNAEQQQNIALANQLSAGYSPRVRQALLAAMSVESGYRNLNYGDRDSQGVLQQRPSQGWGPPGNTKEDINQFLQRAGKADKGFKGTYGQLAQSVQRSAFPGRYDQADISGLLGGGHSPGVARSAPSLGSQPPAPVDQRQALNPITMDILNDIRLSQKGWAKYGNTGPIQNTRQKQAVSAPEAAPAKRNAGGTLLAQLNSMGLGDAITSSVRSPAANRATGGSPTSHHLPGGLAAYDINPNDPDTHNLVSDARSNPGKYEEFFGPVGWYIKGGVVHKGQFPGHKDHFHVVMKGRSR